MKKVIINYSNLTAANMAERAHDVVAALTGNASFPALPVTTVALNTQATVVINAQAVSVNNDRHSLSILRAAKRELARMLSANAQYVNTTAAGNEQMLLTSGYVLSKTPEKGALPGDVASIVAKFTNTPQTIEVIWSSSNRARYYRVFMSADNGTTWTELNSVTTRRTTVNSLISGHRYQFKVIPVGSAGQGNVSEITSQIAG